MAHTGPGFEAAADLLTRTSEIDDVAPDVSVYPEAPDFGTGDRQLEQLAFEIVSKQSLDNAGRKATKLARRRVFAVDVECGRALEWSAELGAWRRLDATGRIEDPALEVPLPVHDIIHAAKADDAVQRPGLLIYCRLAVGPSSPSRRRSGGWPPGGSAQCAWAVGRAALHAANAWRLGICCC